MLEKEAEEFVRTSKEILSGQGLIENIGPPPGRLICEKKGAQSDALVEPHPHNPTNPRWY